MSFTGCRLLGAGYWLLVDFELRASRFFTPLPAGISPQAGRTLRANYLLISFSAQLFLERFPL